MAEINQFINQVELPNNDARGIQTYYSLTIGDQVFNGSNPVTITAANLGLSQALKFVGSTPDVMTDKQTTLPSHINITEPSIGDVVLSNGNGEFVWLGENWEALGSENSYALKTVKIGAGNGLSGGGQLSSDVTLSVNFGNISNLGETTNNGNSVQVARADHIHGLTGITSDVSFINSSATFTSNARIVIGNNSYGNSAPSSVINNPVKGQIYFKLV